MLLQSIYAQSSISESYSLSVEAHPNHTTMDQLSVLQRMGCKRISLGVQDFDPNVQKAIHRLQSVEQTRTTADYARKAGIGELNIDMVYGLPFQTEWSIEHTVQEVLLMAPDRIAFYGYAHVPWKSKSQRGFSEADLPKDGYKRSLFELGRDMILAAGYVSVGIDHFALPHDDLAIANASGQLHRNFMGYTTLSSNMLLGLGCSAISDIGKAYFQTIKSVESYQEAVAEGRLPMESGHVLTP